MFLLIQLSFKKDADMAVQKLAIAHSFERWETRMTSTLGSWQLWAVLSAAFAALTAIFAKVGVENVNSDFATLIRTVVILLVLAAIVVGTGQWQPLGVVAWRTYLFLGFSGLATGASWLCYFRALQPGDAALVAPIDKLSVVLVALFGVILLGERLSRLNWLGVTFIGGPSWSHIADSAEQSHVALIAVRPSAE
jgi:transporter family protein